MRHKNSLRLNELRIKERRLGRLQRERDRAEAAIARRRRLQRDRDLARRGLRHRADSDGSHRSGGSNRSYDRDSRRKRRKKNRAVRIYGGRQGSDVSSDQ